MSNVWKRQHHLRPEDSPLSLFFPPHLAIPKVPDFVSNFGYPLVGSPVEDYLLPFCIA